MILSAWPCLHGLVSGLASAVILESQLDFSSVKHHDGEKVTGDEAGEIVSVRGENCQSLIVDV